MIKFLVALPTSILLLTSAHAADKVRISMTAFAGKFMKFPLAQKRGFLKEEGVEDVPYSEIAELSILREAQRELAIK